MGISFCNLIKGTLNDPSKIVEINETLISLIPKIEPVVNMKHFRLISLCNVSYKTVTKILSARLRNVMKELIIPNNVVLFLIEIVGIIL